MLRRFAFTVCAFSALALPAMAKFPFGYGQSNYNAQIQCQDVLGVSRQLQELAQAHEAKITHLSTDGRNGRGSLNLRMPEAQLGEFAKKLPEFGRVVSENRSYSDNSASYSETRRQLQLAEKLAAAQIDIRSGELTAAERGLCEAEFKAHLRDRINSYRSNLASLESNQGMAELSITLLGQESLRAESRAQILEVEEQPLSPSGEPTTKSNTASATSVGWLGLAPALALAGVAGLYLCYSLGRSRSRAQG